MKFKLKLRSNRKGAGILGVMRTGLCREVTDSPWRSKAQREPSPTNC